MVSVVESMLGDCRLLRLTGVCNVVLPATRSCYPTNVVEYRSAQRVHEHELAVVKQEYNTSLTKHAKETGHIFDFKNTKILAGTNYKKIRQYREAIEIYRMLSLIHI